MHFIKLRKSLSGVFVVIFGGDFMAKGNKVYNDEAAFDRCIDVLTALYEKYGACIKETDESAKSDSKKIA